MSQSFHSLLTQCQPGYDSITYFESLPEDHPIQLVQDPIDIKIATRANCRSIYSLTWSQVQYTTTADLLHITTMQQFTILRGQLERIIILLFIFYSMSPRGDLKRNPF